MAGSVPACLRWRRPRSRSGSFSSDRARSSAPSAARRPRRWRGSSEDGWPSACSPAGASARTRRDQERRLAAEAASAHAGRLVQLTAALAQARTPRAAIEAAVQESLHALQADAGALFLVSRDGALAEVARQVGYPDGHEPSTLALSTKSPISAAVDRGEPVIFESRAARAADYPGAAADWSKDPFEASVAVPLLIGCRVVAVVQLDFHARARAHARRSRLPRGTRTGRRAGARSDVAARVRRTRAIRGRDAARRRGSRAGRAQVRGARAPLQRDALSRARRAHQPPARAQRRAVGSGHDGGRRPRRHHARARRRRRDRRGSAPARGGRRAARDACTPRRTAGTTPPMRACRWRTGLCATTVVKTGAAGVHSLARGLAAALLAIGVGGGRRRLPVVGDAAAAGRGGAGRRADVPLHRAGEFRRGVSGAARVGGAALRAGARSRAALRVDAARAGRRGARQPDPGRVRLDRVARAAHAAQRHPGLDRHAAARHARAREVGPRPPVDPRQRQPAGAA